LDKMKIFSENSLKNLYRPAVDSSGEQNGQVTIIGGSRLFHGAPLLSLKVASRAVDMVFFASPDPSVGDIADRVKSKLMSFIWVPWEDVEAYVEKSDAVLIGPGFMRFGSEKTPHEERNYENHLEGRLTREITESLLIKFPRKRWVIDGGSLQVMEPEWIPNGAILTPNTKEFELLFKVKLQMSEVKTAAKKYNCVIVAKGPETIVCSPKECVLVKGGNPGLTKGGTGDILAGLTVALAAKNDPFLAASSASYLVKASADDLYGKTGVNYNADDLADNIPQTLAKLTNFKA
jgi:hydroxyethylthiazole kinase-like uncharacterized protein yjeF